jgi:hypothetical protein
MIVCVLSAGMSQISDPGILGIHEEPSIILFYGGFGLAAGFSGLLALGSGIYLAATRLVTLSQRPRRILLTALLLLLCAIIVAAVIRFFPAA